MVSLLITKNSNNWGFGFKHTRKSTHTDLCRIIFQKHHQVYHICSMEATIAPFQPCHSGDLRNLRQHGVGLQITDQLSYWKPIGVNNFWCAVWQAWSKNYLGWHTRMSTISLQCNLRHVFSEENPMVFNGDYSQVSIHSIAVQSHWHKIRVNVLESQLNSKSHQIVKNIFVNYIFLDSQT